MGLSEDPEKRRRQLESLKRGAETRAATLQARIDALESQPRSSEDPAVSTSEASSEAGSEVPAAASLSEDRGQARIVPGSYGPAPTAASVEAAAAIEESIDESDEVDADQLAEDVVGDRGEDEGPEGPRLGVRFAAGALGVGKRRRL